MLAACPILDAAEIGLKSEGVNKDNLIAAVAARLRGEHYLQDVAQAVEIVFEEIGHALEERGRVRIFGFGAFEARRLKARVMRNVFTGRVMDVPERWTIRFTPTDRLKQRLCGTATEERDGMGGETRARRRTGVGARRRVMRRQAGRRRARRRRR